MSYAPRQKHGLGVRRNSSCAKRKASCAELRARDLDSILTRTQSLWPELEGKKVFITGGTGFLGHWLTASLLEACDRYGLDCTVVLLTRDPDRFRRTAPSLALHPALGLCIGDVRTFDFPSLKFTHIIHAATESSRLSQDTPQGEVSRTIIEGTKRVLRLARTCPLERLLVVSSGAVYDGRARPGTPISEDLSPKPDSRTLDTSYGQAKLRAEAMALDASRRAGFSVTIARGFAFLGPFLPYHCSLAIANFLFSVLRREPIVLTSDGSPIRSYMYTADSAVWFWTIFLRGVSGQAYNVGSSEAISLLELARLMSKLEEPELPVQLGSGPHTSRVWYLPDTTRARTELGLECLFPLRTSLVRTLAWYRLQDQT
ncbi:MAG: NAD(P)-dependent oxidoreductase [candidate division WOR-3 bacterium]